MCYCYTSPFPSLQIFLIKCKEGRKENSHVEHKNTPLKNLHALCDILHKCTYCNKVICWYKILVELLGAGLLQGPGSIAAYIPHTL